MPELPEVQTMVNDLNSADLQGVVIRRAQVYWDRTIALQAASEFCRLIKGRSIERIYRRAKYIVFNLDAGLNLVVHLRMTGRFEFGHVNTEPGRHVHVVFELAHRDSLMYRDTRKFGRFYLSETPGKILDGLGPEPLCRNFSSKVLANRLMGRKRQIKPLLLDQSFIAGMGNIYTDEALWRAQIHPMRRANSLDRNEIVKLHRAIRYVLRQGLQNGGTTLGNGMGNFKSASRGKGRNADMLKVYRRTGLPCPKCRQPIDRIVVGQRGTHLCRVCQPVR